jgi:hypothetical protein
LKKHISYILVFSFSLFWALPDIRAQINSENKNFEISEGIAKDSAILFVENLLVNDLFLGADSLEKSKIYQVLKSLQLFEYSLKLLELELENEPKKGSWKRADLDCRMAFP